MEKDDLLAAPSEEREASDGNVGVLPLYAVFLLSGAAALIYQVAWQRALFTLFGIDIASVTIVVTAFMLGLGLGSLLGGELSRRAPNSALIIFAIFELGIGAFGFFSFSIFDLVGEVTLGASHFTTGLVSFFLVLFPTLLMGGTLPLLVAHRVQRSRNVGKAVSSLYFANTMGAALGAFATGGFLLGAFGLVLTVKLTAGLNLILALAVYLLHRKEAVAS